MTLRGRLVTMAVGIPVLSLALVGVAQYYVARTYLIYRAAATAQQLERDAIRSRAATADNRTAPVIAGSLTAVYDTRRHQAVVDPITVSQVAPGPSTAGEWVEPPWDSYPNLIPALSGDPTAPSQAPGSLGPGIPRPLYGLFSRLGVVPGGPYPTFMVLHGRSADVLLTAAPLDGAEALVVETPLESVDQQLKAELVVFSAASGVALVGVVIMVLWLTSRALAPLRNVARVANEISAGDLDRRTRLQGRDEVAKVATAFDGMVDRLQVQMAQVSESEAAMRRFLADASHELRTPVTGILGHLEVLRRGAADNPQDLEESLAAMHVTADRLARMVHDLLSLSRLDQGEMAMARAPIDVATLMQDAAGAAEPSTRRHAVTVMPPDATLWAMGDRDAAERILVNLLENAAKYSPPGGPIEVSARPGAAGAVEVLVSDHGPGIPVDDQERIFERFARGDRSRARVDGDGAGLGLAISRSLARGQLGDLTVVSAPGEGSTFVLRLAAGAS